MKTTRTTTTQEVLEQLRKQPQTVKDRMHLLLSDGGWHTKEELHACLWDELSPITAIFAHLTMLRKEYVERGDDLISERSSLGIRYRWAQGHLLDAGTG